MFALANASPCCVSFFKFGITRGMIRTKNHKRIHTFSLWGTTWNGGFAVLLRAGQDSMRLAADWFTGFRACQQCPFAKSKVRTSCEPQESAEICNGDVQFIAVGIGNGSCS